ncbi:UDP-glucose 4-epimerase GalE [Propionivibrio dicarboxylicus]|uniref:UDP-glucose 4-epimerase n=1 Tax=Propionivibrio dicarboxylicus TaxID=83767 RepID=A0A1G7VJ47_9RHOO|nr:UDP-glucose 4-epimerase GalE [Propionivibrio dicarboxylicus]SDG59862.1 UDP-glucose 4-epimerase [Propionivibrio dicarboxylicus]
MHILVTGGCGYIGSHTCVALMAASHQVTIVDDLSNSQASVVDAIARISGQRPDFVKGDVRDRALLRRVFSERKIDAVIHFAGLKAVGESVVQPLRYYDCNVGGAIALCEVMAECGVRTLIFSSSATVYGDPAAVPIREDFPRSATNPYGASKLMIEDILADLARADAEWKIARLRYFNPVGAHESGLIGEAPNGVPNNLMPYVAQVASGQRERLSIFGDDYPTPDGTGVRDYIHVMDLAEGHVAALACLRRDGGVVTVNLGTGRGYSVLEMVRAFERASGKRIDYAVVARRPGDVAACYADTTLAGERLDWRAKRGIDEMCRDAWRWQQHQSGS